jgi:hypothetical protein
LGSGNSFLGRSPSIGMLLYLRIGPIASGCVSEATTGIVSIFRSMTAGKMKSAFVFSAVYDSCAAMFKTNRAFSEELESTRVEKLCSSVVE